MSIALPKLSIITVTYNAEALVEKTILSVINQKYPNLEYIIIDGKSKDNTLNIVNKYKSEIATIISEKDKNLYHAMNKGIACATGDYINFMNAGDVINENFNLTEFMKNGAGKDFLYAKAERIDENGHLSSWHKITPDAQSLSAESFLKGSVICHQAMIPKLELVMPFEEDRWQISADLEWSIKIMKKVKNVFFADETYTYFLEGGVSTDARKKSWLERWKILNEQFGFLKTSIAHFNILINYKN